MIDAATIRQQLQDRRRRLILVDGTVDVIERRITTARAATLIGALEGLDTVSLRHMGPPLMVMLLGDSAYNLNRPINPIATALYHANCIPGTTHPICGDVAIVPDDDFT